MRAIRKLTVVVSIAVLTAQCAAAAGGRMATASPAETGRAMLAAAEKVPAGSRVRVELNDGNRFKAVMLAVEGEQIILQKRTRLPEPPLRLDPSQISYMELEGPRDGWSKMVAIGAAIGTGVTLAFLAILAASLGD